jgi:tetratricopeptide (TPR) repeat protein
LRNRKRRNTFFIHANWIKWRQREMIWKQQNEKRMKEQDRIIKSFFVISLSIILSACAPQKKVELQPLQLEEFQNKTEAADRLFKTGSYACLKESYQIYQELLSIPHNQKNTKKKLLKTAILLAIRQRELGVHDNTYLNEASVLIQNNPFLSDFMTFVDLADSIRLESKGMRGDIIDESRRADARIERLMENIEKWRQELKEKSVTEEFYAYLYIARNCQLYYSRKEKKVVREEADLTHFQGIFPQSPLIQYKLALCPKEDIESLKKLLEEEPRFHEIYYFLGEQALQRRLLISAEKNFLECFKHIPRSYPTVISLASITFAFEELDNSLDFYDKAIALAPESRDALLGKAICLSYLERHDEAIEVCNEILRLGGYYLGDTHYWLAWNQNELERLDEAWESVEKSKAYFIGYSQVFSLAGVIAYKKEEKKVAEKNFQESLRLDPNNCEAAFYLGKIYADRQEWAKSGEYYEKAALCHRGKELALERNISDIEDSSFSEERKQKKIAKKKAQLKKTILTKATFFYNAAAGYFNAKMNEQALKLAQQAVIHSALKEKAEELIQEIKKRK